MVSAALLFLLKITANVLKKQYNPGPKVIFGIVFLLLRNFASLSLNLRFSSNECHKSFDQGVKLIQFSL